MFKRFALIAFIYLIIALIFTYPLITQFNTHIAGVDEDGPVHVWYYWWFYYSLFVLKQNPFFTDYIFYPQVINRTFDIHTFVNSAISVPFQLLFGLVTASNIVLIFTLVANATSAAILTNYLLKSKKASFLAGAIFGFFPYIFAQASDGHTNLISLWFVPLFLYFLLKTLKESSLKNAIFAGLFIGLQGLNDLTTTSFTIILVGLVLFYYFLFQRSQLLNRNTLIKMAAAGGTFLIVFSPMMIMAFYSIFKGFKPDVPLLVQSFWSARLEMFFHPSSMSTFLKEFSDPSMLNPVESTLYLGFVVIYLFLLGLYFIRKLPSEPKKEFGLFFFLAVSFFVLSLGPYLYWNRVRTGIPLPFSVFHLIPLIGGVQEPVRIHPFTMLPLAVIAGFAYKSFEERAKQYGLIFLIGILGVLLVEYIAVPLPTTKVGVPPIYKEIAKDKGEYAILDLPMGWNTGQFVLGLSPVGSIQLAQAYHKKKIFRGTVARLPAENVNYYSTIPGIHYLADPTKEPLPIDTDPALVKETFKKLKINYIIIHKEVYKTKKAKLTDLTMEIINDYLKAPKIVDDENLTVYQVE